MTPILRTTFIMLSLMLGLTGAQVLAQTPAAAPVGHEWWTAWSSCDITPVQVSSPPSSIPGMPDDPISWLHPETTNDSDIEMIVWAWTGNRPLPVDGQYASDGSNAKWLWAFSEEMRDIGVTVTNERGTQGEVQFGGAITSSSTGPINGWPSFAILPEPGCWTFDITATALDGATYKGRIIFPAVP